MFTAARRETSWRRDTLGLVVTVREEIPPNHVNPAV
jgi:hypothetical protein